MLHKCFLVEQNSENTVHLARPNFMAEEAQTGTTAVATQKKPNKKPQKNQGLEVITASLSIHQRHLRWRERLFRCRSVHLKTHFHHCTNEGIFQSGL